MSAAALYEHLATGITTTCRAWDLTRQDGLVMGFTDHDRDIEFDGIRFAAGAGMTARAFEQSTGLSVDNSEALGVVSADGLKEADIAAGRYDGCKVRVWHVNWADIEQRVLQFSGTLGEIERSSAGFRAELLGLSEALNTERGHVFQSACSAVLGDVRCTFDLETPGYRVDAVIAAVSDTHEVRFEALGSYSARWFERGRLEVLSGDAEGFQSQIKNDGVDGEARLIECWDRMPVALSPGDLVRIEAGCDKRSETCRVKFDNLLNFRGFPTIPGDDWLMTYPKADGRNDGGSL